MSKAKGAEKPEKGKRPEKGKPKAAEGKAKAESVLLEDPKQVLESIRQLKALTVYSVAQALGVKASVANALLRKLAEQGLIVKVGGYSGHYVYAVKEGVAQG